MACVMTRVQVGDYDEWKAMFDSDPPGARKSAKGHRVYRLVDNPNEVQIVVEFETTDEATVARDKLLDSGVLERVQVTVPPTLVIEEEALVY